MDQLWLLGGFDIELELKRERSCQMPVAATHEEGCSERYGHEREGVARGGKEGGTGLRSEVFLALCFFEFRSEFSEIASG